MEIKSFGIDVIVIEPGGIKSEWADVANKTLQRTSTSANTIYKELAKGLEKANARTINLYSGGSHIWELVSILFGHSIINLIPLLHPLCCCNEFGQYCIKNEHYKK